MQDPDGDGKYMTTMTNIPPGDYEAKIALDRSDAGALGADGQPDGPNFTFTVSEAGQEIYFEWDSAANTVLLSTEGAPKGNIKQAAAHFVTRDTLVWQPNVPDPERARYALYVDPTAAMTLTPRGVVGGESIPLTRRAAGVHATIVRRFPHLREYTALLLPDEALARVPDILRGQMILVAADAEGKLQDATSIQIPGVLDDLYAYDGALGVVYQDGAPSLKLWAPTALSVTLHLFEDADPAATESQTVPMARDDATGVWTADGAADWTGKYYLYEVEVYAPSTGRIERNLVTDPYSVSLSMNSQRSQIIDLNDPAWKPDGWETTLTPPLDAPEDITIYELHIRDFSAYDQTVPEDLRGAYRAFTVEDSDGMKHLRGLAEAGLSHVQLLPFFDYATVNEDKSAWQTPDPAELATLPPDSPDQQAMVDATRETDPFNWGYDPYHYNTPEGSYATDANGGARIRETREMVQALHESGLRVIMDVVYNHTTASGQGEKSVLDRIVPGYYHRLNAVGEVERSTCCENTATEHVMMEKLMVDSVLLWARHYKIDGFRFDLMGHHLRDNIQAVREALDNLTLEADGVDGASIYILGEGWDFGEVAGNARGRNATQINMAGTGVGTFNDRLRDSARGGSPFGGQQEQGFVTGLLTDPNATDQGDPDAQRDRLLLFADRIRVGLAGNLAAYTFAGQRGDDVTGDRVDYNGAPAGYTKDPQENIVYIEAHDNETFFDMIQYKAPVETSMADRVRMQSMGLSIVALSQGVPFFHAGMDMLRSKSFDRDSYDHGDWFNALHFDYTDNGWGHGLPMADKNETMWPIMGPLLANPALDPAQGDIEHSVALFKEWLQVRYSTPLFRLRTADEVLARVKFHNTGPDQTPGVIVMSIDGRDNAELSQPYGMVVVVFNASAEAVEMPAPAMSGLALALHPVQAESVDPVVRGASWNAESGTFSVPARTTAVFVLESGQ
ncbi:MAG: pullulanase-type alpha-1,6-glucosidase [Anaerolineae bacterium]|nr:pullulanase-type alpha-1,6-glucosidase [Anaerolineae bacterium]